jgi:hypothetical protein
LFQDREDLRELFLLSLSDFTCFAGLSFCIWI